MKNASISDNYLNVVNDNNRYDDDLNLLINEWVKCITGLPEHLIRPLWQPDAPVIPDFEVNWCAFGVNSIADEEPCFELYDESSIFRQNEEVTLLIRFYGQQSQQIATTFRLSILHPQNNYQLNKLGFTLLGVSSLIAFPEFINEKWYRRHDLTIELRRRTQRTYNVKSLLQHEIKFF